MEARLDDTWAGVEIFSTLVLAFSAPPISMRNLCLCLLKKEIGDVDMDVGVEYSEIEGRRDGPPVKDVDF